MKFLPTSPMRNTTVGVEIYDDFVKLAEVSKMGNVYCLMNFAIAPLPPNTVVEGVVVNKQVLSKLVKELLKKSRIKTCMATLCLPASKVFIKHIAFPASGSEAIRKIIVDDLHLHFNFSSHEEAYFDFVINSEDKTNGTKALVVASKREEVDDYLAALRDAGLRIVSVGIDYFALQNIFEINHGVANTICVLVAISKWAAIINIVMGGHSLFTHDLSLQEGDDVPSILSEELKHALVYYNSTAENDFAEHIFVAGEMCSAELLAELARSTGLPTQAMNIFSEGLVFSAKEKHSEAAQKELAAKLLTGIGSAVGAIETYGEN